MTLHPAVLVGLRADAGPARAGSAGPGWGETLEGWMRRLGFHPRITTDAREARAWLVQEEFAVSFVDSDLGRDEGEAVWRTLRPMAARRTVLLARDRGRGLWFEALRSGVATVLPLPPEEAMVRAALEVVARRWGGALPDRRV